MRGPIADYYAQGNKRLLALLDKCILGDGRIDRSQFDFFRHQLLRQVSSEEKILAPALAAKLGHQPPDREGLRKDHAAIAALCVPTPCEEWVENLSELLVHHNRLEESADGFFALCDRSLADDAKSIVLAVSTLPPLRLGPFNDGPLVRQLLARVLAESGIAGTTQVPH